MCVGQWRRARRLSASSWFSPISTGAWCPGALPRRRRPRLGHVPQALVAREHDEFHGLTRSPSALGSGARGHGGRVARDEYPDCPGLRGADPARGACVLAGALTQVPRSAAAHEERTARLKERRPPKKHCPRARPTFVSAPGPRTHANALPPRMGNLRYARRGRTEPPAHCPRAQRMYICTPLAAGLFCALPPRTSEIRLGSRPAHPRERTPPAHGESRSGPRWPLTAPAHGPRARRPYGAAWLSPRGPGRTAPADGERTRA
jgi:hypothetical protein